MKSEGALSTGAIASIHRESEEGYSRKPPFLRLILWSAPYPSGGSTLLGAYASGFQQGFLVGPFHNCGIAGVRPEVIAGADGPNAWLPSRGYVRKVSPEIFAAHP